MTLSLPLLPPPRVYEPGPPERSWTLDWDTAIVLPAGAVDVLAPAARRLQATLHERTGLPFPVRAALDPLAESGCLVLLLGAPPLAPFAGLETLGPEGYVLHNDGQRVVIAGNTPTGVFWGVQTLGQLVRASGRLLPALTVRDWPLLPNRGYMLDVSRGKVPTRQTLFRLVETLSQLKYNHFQLYIEHTFAFPHHPEIAAGCDPLTPDDILALDRFCREHQIELVPNLQSFGHQRHMLSLPQYAHLDEVGWRWSLTPAREETYRLLESLYADFLPNFSSPLFNVDCDETWDLGTGQAKALAQELGKGRLYLRHLLRLRELAARYGRRIMVWADILLHYPELVAELPEDVILLDWQYEAQERYPSAALLGSLGRTFWVCPGTSSWNTLFPRIANAVANIRTFVRDGIAAGATGMLLTDWGDYGHYQPLSLSLYPLAVGAATAWSGPDVPLADLDAAFAVHLFGRPAGDASVQAVHQLGSAVTAPTLGLPNRSNSALALFDEPLAGRLIETIDPAALAQLEDAARAASHAWSQLADPSLRIDYTFSARLVLFACAKLRTSQELRRLLADLPDAPQPAQRDSALAPLASAIARLRAQHARLPALVAEFEAVWLRHARRSEIQQMLDRFAALDRRYRSALDWLTEQQERYAAGQPVDRTLATYDASGYLPLWEEGMAALLELVRLAGAEMLPPEIRRSLEQAGRIGGSETTAPGS